MMILIMVFTEMLVGGGRIGTRITSIIMSIVRTSSLEVTLDQSRYRTRDVDNMEHGDIFLKENRTKGNDNVLISSCVHIDDKFVLENN